MLYSEKKDQTITSFLKEVEEVILSAELNEKDYFFGKFTALRYFPDGFKNPPTLGILYDGKAFPNKNNNFGESTLIAYIEKQSKTKQSRSFTAEFLRPVNKNLTDLNELIEKLPSYLDYIKRKYK